MTSAASQDSNNSSAATRQDSDNPSAASNSPSANKPSPGKPTKQELESLIAQVHLSASIQTERMQAVVDGAILAVEQVQDKRIDLLEKGPEVTVSDIVFDIFVSVCFMGVGKALVPIAQSISRELVQIASYYGRVQSSGKIAGLANALRYVALAAEADFKEEYAVGSITPKEVQKYNKYVRDILIKAAEERTEKLAEAGIEKAKEKVREQSKEGSPQPQQSILEPTDTPGVAILSAAQSYASSQRAAIAVQHAGFEAVVRSEPDNKTLELIRKAVTWSALDDEIISIRDKHKMLFEAVIWAQLFGFDQDTKIGRLSFTQHIELPGVTRPLMFYWRRRFARTIEIWLGSLLDQYPSGPPAISRSEGVDPIPVSSLEGGKYKVNPGTFESANHVWQQAVVIRFFAAITSDLKNLYEEGIGKGAVQITTKPVAKKE